MLGIKIWFTAQFINALVCTLCFLKFGLISIPFAAIGGIPALIIFVIWTAILKADYAFIKNNLWLTYLVVAGVTACCSFGVLILMDFAHGAVPFAIIPIPASLLSTLIFNNNIIEITQTNNDTTTT